SRGNQPLFWALLITLTIICAFWGFISPFPYNLILYALAIIAFISFLVLLRRSYRGIPRIDATEVRRLVACDACKVESEGPFEKGDYVFREVGKCPRCGGLLYVKALYGVDEKTPFKRQQPPSSQSED
ncbi:MAG: hypothetical protein ACFFCO_07330, partial [Promethearchaeota archaeon]